MVDAATVMPYQQPMQFQQQIQPYQQMQVQPYQQQMQPYQQQVVQSQPFSNGISAQTNSISGQYVCPVHGAVGLPQFNATGSPVCPLGDQIMQFHSTGANSSLALAAGG
ncbi:MAG: hypothetical protein HQK72_05410 [Desulfamplus sp.]|nr:hypothetical protein [Desulfamplus sp.]